MPLSALPLHPVPSPCVRLCTLDQTDVCVGCGRTLADITAWTKMSDEEKAACVHRGRETLQRMGRPLPPYPPPPAAPLAPRRR
jgi:predicted Fe-S protein YdhL (DUF1289 family)